MRIVSFPSRHPRYRREGATTTTFPLPRTGTPFLRRHVDHRCITDSTDWLSTPLAALTPLESSLRCQVCKDFLTTPMITSCSHTFCSLCIRRYLSQEGRCPACRESDQEMKLRRNWVVEELVTNFTASRNGLLTYAREAAMTSADMANESERPKKRRKVITSETNVTAERRSTRSQSKRIASQASQYSVPSTQEEIADSDEGSVFEDDQQNSSRPIVPEPNDGLVSCPCCGRRMKETQINSHLDRCIAGDSRTPVDSSPPPPPIPSQAQHLPPGTIAYTQTQPAKQKERLPFINYTLLNDNALRKKLRELGIPSQGSKDLMRKRHTEWVNLWNANCDSRNPIPKSRLLQDLDTWERTLGRQIDGRGPSGVMVKDFDRDSYVKTQKSNFDDLIVRARLKRASPATEKQNEVENEHHEVDTDSGTPGFGADEERTIPSSPAKSMHGIITSSRLPDVKSPHPEPDLALSNGHTDSISEGTRHNGSLAKLEDVVDLTSPAKPTGAAEPDLSQDQKSMSNDIPVMSRREGFFA